jgi:hypothetical protein
VSPSEGSTSIARAERALCPLRLRAFGLVFTFTRVDTTQLLRAGRQAFVRFV